MVLIAAQYPAAAAFAQAPMILAPFLPGQNFCDDAVADPSILNDEAAAALCAALAALVLSRLAGLGGSGHNAVEPSPAFERALRPSTTAGT